MDAGPPGLEWLITKGAASKPKEKDGHNTIKKNCRRAGGDTTIWKKQDQEAVAAYKRQQQNES